MANYCTQSDIQDQFAPSDVQKWADNENNGDATYIANRIARALVEGTREVNDQLRGGPYTVPFTSVPAIIVQLAATFAAVWLYKSRGVQDSLGDDLAGRLSAHRKDALMTCRRIVAGQIQLDVLPVSEGVPRAVSSSTSTATTSTADPDMFKVCPPQ